jgi:hypothetical protein
MVGLVVSCGRYRSFSSDQLSPVDVWLVMLKSALGDE